MITDIFYDMNLFVDGRGFAGKVKEVVLPKITLLVQEHKAGGMSAPIDIPMLGHEKMESEITLASFDPEILKLFKISLGTTVPFTARGALQDDDGTKHGIVAHMRGLIKEYDMGTWKSGEEAQLKLGLTLHYDRLIRDGEDLIESEPAGRLLKVGGVDLLSETREALGI